MVKQPVLIVLALIAGVAVSSRPPASSSAPPSAPSNATEADDQRRDAPDISASIRDTIVLPRDPDGHFYTDAVVNGTTIRFMVDTGASTVALTRDDAQRAGMFFAENDFNQVGRGAGGDVPLRSVTLGSVAVGTIELRDVRGVVIGGNSDVSLLGQSFLSTLASVTIEGDEMVLRPA